MRRTRFRLTAAIAIVALAGGVGFGRVSAADAPAKTTLNVGVIKIGALADIDAAQALGYFAKQGLEVNLTTANNGNDLLTALQSGKLDIALAIPGVAMRAREKGYRVSLVYQNELAHAKAPDTGALIVPAGSSITSIKGLAGKKVAHAGIGTQAWAAVRYVEQKAGLDPASVQEVEISYPQMPGVLRQGLVDAVVSVDPFTSQMLEDKQGRVLSWVYVDAVRNMPIGSFWAADDWLAKHAADAKRFAAAMHGAMTYLNAHPADAKKYVADYTGLKAEIVDKMTPIRWDDRVDKAAWRDVGQMLMTTGVLQKKPDIDAMIPQAALDPGRR